MRYIFLFLFLVSSLFSFQWPDEYDAALSQAKKEHKDVYVFVGSAYCSFCTKLKETTFADKEVLKALKKDYVNIYLSKDIDDIPSNLTIPFVPAHYFLTSDGKMIYSTAGYKSKEAFLELLDDVKELKSL